MYKFFFSREMLKKNGTYEKYLEHYKKATAKPKQQEENAPNEDEQKSSPISSTSSDSGFAEENVDVCNKKRPMKSRRIIAR